MVLFLNILEICTLELEYFFPDDTSDKSKAYGLHAVSLNLKDSELKQCAFGEESRFVSLDYTDNNDFKTKFSNMEKLKSLSAFPLNPINYDEARIIHDYLFYPKFTQNFDSEINKGKITDYFKCTFNFFKRGFDKLANVGYRTVYKASKDLDPKLFKQNSHVSTRAFTLVYFSFDSVCTDDITLIFKITARRNLKFLKDLNKKNLDTMLFPPATRFVVTKDPHALICLNIYGSLQCSAYYGVPALRYTCKAMIVELEEIDEDYGPIIFEELHTPTPTKSYIYTKKSTSTYSGFTPVELNFSELDDYSEDYPDVPSKEEKLKSKYIYIIVAPVITIILLLIVAFILYLCRKSALKDTNTHNSM